MNNWVKISLMIILILQIFAHSSLSEKLKSQAVQYSLDLAELKHHDEVLAGAVKALSYQLDVLAQSMSGK